MEKLRVGDMKQNEVIVGRRKEMQFAGYKV